MGASASADFYQYLVRLSQSLYHAEQDHEFPPMMLYNLPLCGFDETGFQDIQDVKRQLIAGVQRLESAGSDFVVIPCNTVHLFADEMQSALSIPLVNILDAVADSVKSHDISHIGILCSESTKQYQLYEKAFHIRGIKTSSSTDDEQRAINQVIARVMSGTQGINETLTLSAIIDRYAREGAEAVCIGCTELPLALSNYKSEVLLFNSTSLLAEAALRVAYRTEPFIVADLDKEKSDEWHNKPPEEVLLRSK